MNPRRTLIIPVLLAATATIALAQDRSDRSRRSGGSRNGSSSSASPTSQPTTFLDGYRLVLDRNIFSRNRVIYRESSPTPTTAPSGSFHSLPALSLTGVTKEAGVATAFIEDRRTNQTTFHRVGDPLADGKLTAINLDSIEYITAAGNTLRVELGQPLETGPTYSVSSSSFAPAGSTPSSASPSAPAASGDSNDILERLRQKRLQETKR